MEILQSRTLIKNLANALKGKQQIPVTLCGWVHTLRDQKKIQFIILQDESGMCQLVHHKDQQSDPAQNTTQSAQKPEPSTQKDALSLSSQISSLSQGTMLRVRGTAYPDPRVKLGGFEVKVEKIQVESNALTIPITPESSIDKRLDWRFLDLRTPANALIFRVQTTLLNAMRQFWINNGYTEIFTPKLMSSPSESRAELFELPYFDTRAYLAQSPQFYKQMAQAAGFGKVFEIAPAFRADPSFTSRHATEFTSIDAEVSWIENEKDIMQMHEDLLYTSISAVLQAHQAELKQHFPTLPHPHKCIPRLPLLDARKILQSMGHTFHRADLDLDPEAERKIGTWAKEELDSDFIFITKYPASIRPFYHMKDAENPELTNSYDLLYKGVEIATGAQREHRYSTLLTQAQEKGIDPTHIEGYLDFFKYGIPPHGGFGMGAARLLMLMLGLESIKESTYLFRGPNRLTP